MADFTASLAAAIQRFEGWKEDRMKDLGGMIFFAVLWIYRGLQLTDARNQRDALQARLTVSEGRVQVLESQLEAAPSKELQTWIDRYNQVIKDHTASHAAAERLLLERNQLQNALDRIEYAATTAQPVSDQELMKALESERESPFDVEWQCIGCLELLHTRFNLTLWRWSGTQLEHRCGPQHDPWSPCKQVKREPVKEFRGGCMGHA